MSKLPSVKQTALFLAAVVLPLMLGAIPTAVHSQDQTLRMCCYNVLDGPVSTADDLDFRVVMEAIGNQTILGNTRQLDLLAVQEGPASFAQYADIEDNLEAVFGGTYATSVTIPDFAGCRTGFIYNTSTLQLISATSLVAGLTHNSRRTQFRPVGGTSADDFYIYAIHLRAGTFDPADAAERVEEATLIRNDAETLPANSQIIYCGDFNIAGSDEGAYQALFAGDVNATARETLNTPFGFRPNTEWQENFAFLPFHTQNPVDNMDDRFDAFYVNSRVIDGENFEYIPGSCTVLGNNGTHALNQSINTGTGTAGFATELIATSDHLPVICDFRWGQTAPEFNNEVSLAASNSNFVRSSGPVGGPAGTADLEIEGSSNGTFASFGVIDFDLGSVLGKSDAVNLVDNIALNLIQDNEFFTDGGPFAVYLASAAATNIAIDASIQYQSGQNGISSVPAVLANGAVKLATYAGVHELSGGLLPDGTPDPVALYGAAIQTAIADAISSQGSLRLLLVPELAGTAATFTGFNSGLGAPTLAADFFVDDGIVEVVPIVPSLVAGVQGEGNAGGTTQSDDIRIEYFSEAVDAANQPAVQLIFSSSLPNAGTPQSIDIVIESQVNSPNLEIVVEQFNFKTNQWEIIDTVVAEQADETMTIEVTGDLSNYVGSAGALQARIGWIPTGPVLQFPWQVAVDRFSWSVLE